MFLAETFHEESWEQLFADLIMDKVSFETLARWSLVHVVSSYLCGFPSGCPGVFSHLFPDGSLTWLWHGISMIPEV